MLNFSSYEIFVQNDNTIFALNVEETNMVLSLHPSYWKVINSKRWISLACLTENDQMHIFYEVICQVKKKNAQHERLYAQ